MLRVNGLIALPIDLQIKDSPTNGGHLFFFTAITKDPRDSNSFHLYPIKLWVTHKEVDTWKERLQPGRIFEIEFGYLSMKQTIGGRRFSNVIEIIGNNLKPLSLGVMDE
jgi:hypothetical protein